MIVGARRDRPGDRLAGRAARASRSLVLERGERRAGATRRGRRDARAGHRGGLRRAGADRAEPRGRARAIRPSPPSSRPRRASQTGYRRSGTLSVAVDRDQAEELERLHEFQRSLGLEAEWLSARECRRLEPGLATARRRRRAGARRPPGRTRGALAAALRAALERARRRAAGRTPVPRSLAVDGRQRRRRAARRSGDELRADQVVVAAGAGSGDDRGPAGRARSVPVRPVKGQILRLRGDAAAPQSPGGWSARPRSTWCRARTARWWSARRSRSAASTRTVTAGGVLELLRRAYEALPGHHRAGAARGRAGLRPGTPGQPARRRRGRARRARVGDRPLAQRRPAGAAHGRRGRPRCSPDGELARSLRPFSPRAVRAPASRSTVEPCDEGDSSTASRASCPTALTVAELVERAAPELGAARRAASRSRSTPRWSRAARGSERRSRRASGSSCWRRSRGVR